MPEHHSHAHGDSHSPQPVEDRYDEEFWEDRYGSQSAIWSGNANLVLAAETADLSKGWALDVGCGEGGDAIWLAQQGWTVTAVDFSTVALERGAARAKELGLDEKITWVHADLTQWQPTQTYDLISSHYLHLLGSEQEDLLARLVGAVAPSGTLLYVAHFFDDHFVEEHPHLLNRSFAIERITDMLDAGQWEILFAGERRRADAGEHPAGHVHDSVVRARRRG